MSTCRHIYLGMACGQPAEYIAYWASPVCGHHARMLDALTKGEAPFIRDRDPEAAAVARADKRERGECINCSAVASFGKRCAKHVRRRVKP